MNGKKRLLGFGLAMILGGSLAAAPRASAQENSPDTRQTKSKNEDGAGLSGTGEADERDRQSENRSDDFRRTGK